MQSKVGQRYQKQADDRLQLYKTASLGLALFISIVILVAWASPSVSALLPSFWSQMKANTALSISLISLSFLVLNRDVSFFRNLVFYGLVLAALTLSGSALISHTVDHDFLIATLWATDPSSLHPGLMSLQTAFFLSLIGILLLFETFNGRLMGLFKDGMVIILIGTVLVVLSGYLFKASLLFGQPSGSLTSPHTLMSFILLTFSAILHRKSNGLFAIMLSQGPVLQLLKVFLPVVLVVPFAVIGAFLYATSIDVISLISALALSASVMATILMLSVLILAKQQAWNIDNLKQSEQKNRLILNSAAESILGLDRDGSINFINDAGCLVLRDKAEHLIGLNFHHRFHNMTESGRLIDENECKMCNLFNDEMRLVGIESFIVPAVGSGFPVEYSRSLIKEQDQIMGAVISFTDISSRKKIERLKEEFVATVSHELRTPLTSIKGALALVNSGKLAEIPLALKSLLTVASDNSERLNLLINDLLDFNKLQLSQSEFVLIDVAELVNKAIEANQGYAEKYQVELVNTTHLNNSIQVSGDEMRLMQVFANLLSNAIKYSKVGGQIVVHAEKIDNVLKVTVTDNGSGIPIDYQSHVFEKFSQADSSNTRKNGGTGLGLAITKEIVEKHGGTIGFKSKEGEGTVFYFELPVITVA